MQKPIPRRSLQRQQTYLQVAPTTAMSTHSIPPVAPPRISAKIEARQNRGAPGWITPVGGNEEKRLVTAIVEHLHDASENVAVLRLLRPQHDGSSSKNTRKEENTVSDEAQKANGKMGRRSRERLPCNTQKSNYYARRNCCNGHQH
jgi:hypothetical protein